MAYRAAAVEAGCPVAVSYFLDVEWTRSRTMIDLSALRFGAGSGAWLGRLALRGSGALPSLIVLGTIVGTSVLVHPRRQSSVHVRTEDVKVEGAHLLAWAHRVSEGQLDAKLEAVRKVACMSFLAAVGTWMASRVESIHRVQFPVAGHGSCLGSAESTPTPPVAVAVAGEDRMQVPFLTTANANTCSY
jgi:hypothetical protein